MGDRAGLAVTPLDLLQMEIARHKMVPDGLTPSGAIAALTGSSVTLVTRGQDHAIPTRTFCRIERRVGPRDGGLDRTLA